MTVNTSHPSGLDLFAQTKLSALEAKNRRRKLATVSRASHMEMTDSSQKTLINFSDNDYLGLAFHPDVIEASRSATQKYGAGAGASRLVTGHYPLCDTLETKIAKIKGTEAALVFGSGYLANTGIISTLMGAGDLILADELVHNSIRTGIALSKADSQYFRHSDVAHVEAILQDARKRYTNVLIIVDGVYSMDGDIAPLLELGELAAQHSAWLMNDDAHALGTIGGGRGSAHACGAEHLVHLQMGTLSKGVGSYGGYLAASEAVIDLMITRARTFIYTTGLPPGVTAASLKALEIIETDTELVARPVMLAKKFAAAVGLAEPFSPIVPMIIGDEREALEASEKLAKRGFRVVAIRPPTVAEGTSRLRFNFSAAHRDTDVDGLIEACLDLGLKSELGAA
ncbi:MAG: 8-amino-7-oxononanoate synthase [Kordiimonadales bacterium]|nr:MAG: 8-amino-7-oxononanoate synthase [Kordiimonadales bacterium]